MTFNFETFYEWRIRCSNLWTPWFAWHPVRVSPNKVAWLEWVDWSIDRGVNDRWWYVYRSQGTTGSRVPYERVHPVRDRPPPPKSRR